MSNFRNNIVFIIILVFCQITTVLSIPAFPLVQFKGQQYQLEFNKNQLLAKKGNQIIQGELEKRVGNFSQWTFQLTNGDGLNIIVNQNNNKIMSQKNLLEAGGPYLIAASPDSKYVVFDYGCCPTPRDFEVRTKDGKVIFKSTYLNRLTWTNQGLEYAHPTPLPIDLNEKTKTCRNVGAAWKLEMYQFSHSGNRKLNVPNYIECSN